MSALSKSIIAGTILLSIFAIYAQLEDEPRGVKIPPTEIWSTGTTGLFQDANNMAEVHANTDKKEVIVDWMHYPLPPTATGRSVKSWTYHTQFWPTEVAGAGLALYVGGDNDEGETVLQKWVFRPPLTPQTEAVLLERNEVIDLFEGVNDGCSGIIELSQMISAPDDLLVFFHTPRELWKYSMRYSSWEKVASPHDTSVIHVAELAEDWSMFHVREHVTEGSFYTFGHPFRDYTITFVDSNRDGVLDHCMRLTTDEWYAAGYGDPSSYVASSPF